jgi:hypothetical protein
LRVKRLFKPKGLIPQLTYGAFWDASSDGKEFIFPVSTSAKGTAPTARFTVIFNWPSLLKK